MFQSTFSKIAVTTVTGAVAASVVAGPALAADHKPDGGAHYKGRVIAKTGLLVRSGPSTSHRVVDSNPYGAKVRIVCKVKGENIDGNPRWYLLSSGKYAWSSARYIENIGKAPEWC